MSLSLNQIALLIKWPQNNFQIWFCFQCWSSSEWVLCFIGGLVTALHPLYWYTNSLEMPYLWSITILSNTNFFLTYQMWLIDWRCDIHDHWHLSIVYGWHSGERNLSWKHAKMCNRFCFTENSFPLKYITAGLDFTKEIEMLVEQSEPEHCSEMLRFLIV